MTAIQDPAAATYLDKTHIAHDVVAADFADLLRDLLTETGFEVRLRLVRAAEEKEKQPQAYAVGVKPG